MERRGIAVDGDELAQAGEDFVVMESKLEKQIYEHAGRAFNLASSKQLRNLGKLPATISGTNDSVMRLSSWGCAGGPDFVSRPR